MKLTHFYVKIKKPVKFSSQKRNGYFDNFDAVVLACNVC